jgi:hypothetical protein
LLGIEGLNGFTPGVAKLDHRQNRMPHRCRWRRMDSDASIDRGGPTNRHR